MRIFAPKNKTKGFEMSITALTNLRDYLTTALSIDDMIWLRKEMDNFLRGSDGRLVPYTKEEINAMLDEAEANFAAGRGISHEEVMREWDEEISRMEQEEHEMAEAV